MGARTPRTGEDLGHRDEAGAPDAPRRRGRVLLVDDEQAMLLLLERLLRAEHEVVAVGSVPEALALFEQGERFDVVLCDLMMPGMSGMDLHRTVSATDPQLAARLVFCTAGADSPQLRAFLDAAGNRFISKPFKMAQVRGLVREFVG